MDLYLIASTLGTLGWLWVIVQVAVALGAVIFVHELGHFLVAKACGVQCDKFFIGFDLGGYKISRKWGETEYGIGILPLGGYVKMLGQDDNPANAAREMERARIAKQKLEGDASSETPTSEPSTTDSNEEYVLNPRSYLAKSVPQRMAIISAGVIMNVIFAVIFASFAYWIGVPYLPCVVSKVAPGSPAWAAGLRTGDEVARIGNTDKPGFVDLKAGVSLGDLQRGVRLKVNRPGEFEDREFVIKPQQASGLPTIGLQRPWSTTLSDPPALPDTPAAKAGFQAGDRIVAIGGQPVEDYREMAADFVRHPAEPLKITVLREEIAPSAAGGGEKAERVDLELAPNHMKDFGLVMKMGPITAVQAESPAAAAGLKEGDFIAQLNGGSVGDPMTLPDRLRELAAEGKEVTLTITRMADQQPSEPLEVTIKLRDPVWWEDPIPVIVEGEPGDPMSAPALGIAYRVLNKVHSVEPDGPAENAKILPGDVITQARFVPSSTDKSPMSTALAKTPIPLDDTPNWPAFIAGLQFTGTGTEVELTVKTGDELRTVTLAPTESATWFNPERGLALEPLKAIRKANSASEAIALGAKETKNALLMVYRFLQKLGHQVPVTMIGGPLTIAQAAGYSAMEGPATLLIFLTMLSANLAVVNFLPIPVLDGGHMVFLILEGIFRRPVSEKVVVALQTLGFVFLAGLMILVLALDIGRLVG